MLTPQPASLWWTSTSDSEEKVDLSFDTTGRHRFPFEEQFKILDCTLNRQGKTHECLEERMRGRQERNTWLRKVRRKPMSELYVNGNFTEDREEWQRELQRHDQEDRAIVWVLQARFLYLFLLLRVVIRLV